MIGLVISACSTTRKKSEVKGFKKFYHNTTAKFNGYFNAQELLKYTMLTLEDMHQDNYNEILNVYDYVNVDNPQAVVADMDKAIEKATTVATIHEISNYLDDCYVLIGKAQFLKHDYAAAEETFQYFEEEFDPLNPYGRVYQVKNKKKTGNAARKELKEERKEKEEERKEVQKTREEERKEKQKEREAREKERKKASKERKKNAKKGRDKSRSSRSKSTDKEEDSVEVEKSSEQKAIEEANKKKLEEAKKLAEAKAKEEEEKKKEEDDKYDAEGEGAIFKNKSAYTEGLYWLARTYIERGRYSTADYIIKRLENTPGLTESVSRKLPAAKASMYLKSKEYAQALVALDEGIEKEKSRKSKGRYAFIKAQIYEKLGDDTKAGVEYERARKFSPGYEMKLNANLNELKLAYRNGSSSKKQIIRKLEKMLDDNKNVNFQDQIFFAIAQVKLDSGDTDGAIADFENALNSGGSNSSVKLESYYRLANLLFEEGEYTLAKSNYDRALDLMKPYDDRYREAERLSKNLTEVAKNIELIALQDSLLKLALLDEDELKEIAEKILEERGNQRAEDLNSGNEKSVISSSRSIGAQRSSFFAYNPLALNKGKIDFERTWGDRSYEDNWRRSLRADASLLTDDLTEEGIDEEVEFSEGDIAAVLRDIPKSDNQKQAAHLKIQNALLDLGILFRERIRNYEKSIEVLERLVREYPSYEKRDEALFYLYRSYADAGKNSDAQTALSKLTSEFPNSKYAKLATDPNYANSLRSNEETINSYYDNTYNMFEKGNFEAVVERVKELKVKFPGNKDYAAKFSLINAMSYGSLEGKDRYIKELQNLIRVYPKTPEEARAKEILRFLKGDQSAFNEILFDEDLDVFEVDDKKLHYVFVVTYDLGQKEFDRTKLDISSYNKEFHRFDNLKISNIYLDPEAKSQIILIRSFNDKDKAMAYLLGVNKNKDGFIKNEETGYDIFAATQRNYREVIKQRKITNYRSWFEANYMKK